MKIMSSLISSSKMISCKDKKDEEIYLPKVSVHFKICITIIIIIIVIFEDDLQK